LDIEENSILTAFARDFCPIAYLYFHFIVMASRIFGFANRSTSLAARFHRHMSFLPRTDTLSLGSSFGRSFSTKSDDADTENAVIFKKGEVLSSFNAARANHADDSYYKDNPDELSPISQRYTDDLGLFTRKGPTMFERIPDASLRSSLHENTVYYRSGDVDVYVYMSAYPDYVHENSDASARMFKALTPDAVVLPLCSPRNDGALMFLGQPIPSPFLTGDEFHEGYAQIITPETMDAFESHHVYLQQAVSSGASISLGGRHEAITYINLLYKRIYNELSIPAYTYQGFASASRLIPNPTTPFMVPLNEITGAFEPALVYAAALRTTIEEQQELADANPDGGRRTVFAFVDASFIRHIENAYDLLPVLSREDMIYLKHGYDAAYKELHDETLLGDCVPEMDKDRFNAALPTLPGLKNYLVLKGGRFKRQMIASSKSPSPWRNIHLLFTQMYGPQASDRPSCGACKFVYDSNGNYQAVCKDSGMNLTGVIKSFLGFDAETFCLSPDHVFELGQVPDLVRPVSSDPAVESLYKETTGTPKDAHARDFKNRIVGSSDPASRAVTWNIIKHLPVDGIVPPTALQAIAEHIEAAGVELFPQETQDAFKKLNSDETFLVSDFTHLMLLTEDEGVRLFDNAQRQFNGEIDAAEANAVKEELLLTANDRFMKVTGNKVESTIKEE
jgi:hypothetical protein